MSYEWLPNVPPVIPRTVARAEDVNVRYQNVIQAFNKLPLPLLSGRGFSEPVIVGEAVLPDHAVTLDQLQRIIADFEYFDPSEIWLAINTLIQRADDVDEQIVSILEELVAIQQRISDEIAQVDQRINDEVITINTRVDAEVNTLNARVTNEVQLLDVKIAQKQDQLVSGQNIKTINGESILGSGNLVVNGGGGSGGGSLLAGTAIECPDGVIDLAQGNYFRVTLSEAVQSISFINYPDQYSAYKVHLDLLCTQDYLNNHRSDDVWPVGSKFSSTVGPYADLLGTSNKITFSTFNTGVTWYVEGLFDCDGGLIPVLWVQETGASVVSGEDVYLRKVIYNEDAEKFVSITSQGFFSSTDGFFWDKARDFPLIVNGVDVSTVDYSDTINFIYHKGVYVANASYLGGLAYSINGSEWFSATGFADGDPSFGAISHIYFSELDQKFYATTTTGSFLRESSDGITWTLTPEPAKTVPAGVTRIGANGEYYIFTTDGTGEVYTSTNGLDWSLHSTRSAGFTSSLPIQTPKGFEYVSGSGMMGYTNINSIPTAFSGTFFRSMTYSPADGTAQYFFSNGTTTAVSAFEDSFGELRWHVHSGVILTGNVLHHKAVGSGNWFNGVLRQIGNDTIRISHERMVTVDDVTTHQVIVQATYTTPSGVTITTHSGDPISGIYAFSLSNGESVWVNVWDETIIPSTDPVITHNAQSVQMRGVMRYSSSISNGTASYTSQDGLGNISTGSISYTALGNSTDMSSLQDFDGTFRFIRGGSSEFQWTIQGGVLLTSGRKLSSLKTITGFNTSSPKAFKEHATEFVMTMSRPSSPSGRPRYAVRNVLGSWDTYVDFFGVPGTSTSTPNFEVFEGILLPKQTGSVVRSYNLATRSVNTDTIPGLTSGQNYDFFFTKDRLFFLEGFNNNDYRYTDDLETYGSISFNNHSINKPTYLAFNPDNGSIVTSGNFSGEFAYNPQLQSYPYFIDLRYSLQYASNGSTDTLSHLRLDEGVPVAFNCNPFQGVFSDYADTNLSFHESAGVPVDSSLAGCTCSGGVYYIVTQTGQGFRSVDGIDWTYHEITEFTKFFGIDRLYVFNGRLFVRFYAYQDNTKNSLVEIDKDTMQVLSTSPVNTGLFDFSDLDFVSSDYYSAHPFFEKDGFVCSFSCIHNSSLNEYSIGLIRHLPEGGSVLIDIIEMESLGLDAQSGPVEISDITYIPPFDDYVAVVQGTFGQDMYYSGDPHNIINLGFNNINSRGYLSTLGVDSGNIEA
jgi:hypothetical protein